VICLDLTEAMREKLRANAAAAGAANLEVLAGNAEAIPLPDASVDVVTSNGVVNLVPDKARAIREVARVLRSGGWLQLADIVVRTLPSEACRSHPELWAECIVGATTAETYAASSRLRACDVSAEPQRLLQRQRQRGTRQVAGSFGHAVVLRARKP
jgi:ubiquinone/menaquinone biosynthesis C-methylase UbiE